MPRVSKTTLLLRVERLLEVPGLCLPEQKAKILEFCSKRTPEELVKIVVQLRINREALLSSLTAHASDLKELKRRLDALVKKYEISS